MLLLLMPVDRGLVPLERWWGVARRVGVMTSAQAEVMREGAEEEAMGLAATLVTASAERELVTALEAAKGLVVGEATVEVVRAAVASAAAKAVASASAARDGGVATVCR